MAKMGQPCIFDHKTVTILGKVPPFAAQYLEAARVRLAQIACVESVSTADTLEFVLSGEANAIAYVENKEEARRA